MSIDTQFEQLKAWAESNGYEWRSAYGHFSKRVITHNSTPPINLETEEMQDFFDIAENQAKQRAAEELRQVPQDSLGVETYLWERIDELEGRKANDE